MVDAGTYARGAAVLGILAAVLLANPAYVGLFVDEPRERSPTGYHAVTVNPENRSDQQTIVQHLGSEEILDIDELSEEESYNPYGARYRAPDRAADVLRQARSDGAAATTRDDVAFTLQRLAANQKFVTFHDGDPAQYYRFSVNASGNETVVTLEEVSLSVVSWSVVYHDTRLYSSLPDYQQETMQKVIAAGDSAYRPYNDEFVELTDSLIYRNGTYYLFQTGVHVDDFGPSLQAVVSVVLSGLGILSLFVSVVFTTISFRRSG